MQYSIQNILSKSRASFASGFGIFARWNSAFTNLGRNVKYGPTNQNFLSCSTRALNTQSIGSPQSSLLCLSFQTLSKYSFSTSSRSKSSVTPSKAKNRSKTEKSPTKSTKIKSSARKPSISKPSRTPGRKKKKIKIN